MKELLIDCVILYTAMSSQTYLQTNIISILFNTKITQKEAFIFSIVAGVIQVSAKMLIPQTLSAINPIIFIITNIVFLSFYKKITIFKSLIYALLIMVISIPVEILSGIFVFTILKLPNNTENVVATIPIFIMITIWYLIIIGFLHLFRNRKNIHLQFNSNFIGINILLVFLIFAPNIMFYAMNNYNYPVWLLIYNILANIILVILAIYNTYKNIQLEATERDLQNSEMHNKSLNELVDSIRVFKHDYNNVVHAIGGYIATNDMDGLKKYYEGLAKDSKRVNQLENISPDKINEPSIYGIFASKYQTAESKHIEFNFESMINYQNLEMPVYDFCKILGVLLDNAIEAAEETEDKKINVSVRQSNKTGIQLISIENTYLNKDIDTKKIYEKNYSTKNRNSGLGLWEVKNIVDRNSNVTLVTNKDEKFFKQELYIKIKEKQTTDNKEKITIKI